MLDELLGSKTRAGLVSALLNAPDHAMHLRALVRAAGTSISSVQRELDRLEAMGLVESARDAAGRRQVHLVDGHPFTEPLAGLVAAEARAAYGHTKAEGASLLADEELARLNPRVRPMVTPILNASGSYGVQRLSLFGSATQSDPLVMPRDPDVTVRFDPSDPRPKDDLYFGLLSELQRATGLPVQLMSIDAIRNPYLRAEIERTEVVLHEAP